MYKQERWVLLNWFQEYRLHLQFGQYTDKILQLCPLSFFFNFLGKQIHDFFFTNHRTAWEGGGHFFNSSLPLPPASHILRHQPGDYCRELTSVHRQQSDSNRELLVSERKSLTTKLRAINVHLIVFFFSGSSNSVLIDNI